MSSRLVPDDEAMVTSSATGLASGLEAERSGLERELAEIDLLLRQATTESDRHEQRRVQLAERVAALEAEPSPAPAELKEARDQLNAQTRRAALMGSQVQVLEGKKRTLQRFEERLRETVAALGTAAPGVESSSGGGGPSSSRAVMAAQEHMRREIARQMHDGPAQSIANIALQAEVVQRLLRRDVDRAEKELAELQSMAQHTLEQTKRFIFEVRPMVLDDLGIVPTLRRSARERAQRSSVPIRFESIGADRRLEPEVESNLFRIVDQALTSLVEGRPEEVHVRMSWTDDSLETTVHSRLAPDADAPEDTGEKPPSTANTGDHVPAALAAMITDQRAREAADATARRRARGLPASAWDGMRALAESVGMFATLEEESRLLRIRATVPPR